MFYICLDKGQLFLCMIIGTLCPYQNLKFVIFLPNNFFASNFFYLFILHIINIFPIGSMHPRTKIKVGQIECEHTVYGLFFLMATKISFIY